MPGSHFHPNTHRQWAWDSTSLGYLKECPRKYYYIMIGQWRPRGIAIDLVFGIMFHKALELFDKARCEGDSYDDALDKAIDYALCASWDDKDFLATENKYKNRKTLVRTIVWYFEEYKDDYAQTYVLANGKPAVELSFKFKVNDEITLAGHMDRMIVWENDLYVMDRKTTKMSLAYNYFDQFTPDNQMSLYATASRVVFGTKVKGVLIDAAELKMEFSRFARGFAHRTDDQLEQWLTDTLTWIDQAHWFAERDEWPMNDKSCHKYGGCPFRDVCKVGDSVRENFLEAGFDKSEWNPLIER